MVNEQQLVNLSSAVLATQTAILAGLINAKLVDPRQMRDWLQSLIDDLKPEEREQAYGTCLKQVVLAIEKLALGERPKAPNLH
jgi:hypothetical protein